MTQQQQQVKTTTKATTKVINKQQQEEVKRETTEERPYLREPLAVRDLSLKRKQKRVTYLNNFQVLYKIRVFNFFKLGKQNESNKCTIKYNQINKIKIY